MFPLFPVLKRERPEVLRQQLLTHRKEQRRT